MTKKTKKILRKYQIQLLRILRKTYRDKDININSHILFLGYLTIILNQLNREMQRDILTALALEKAPYAGTRYTVAQEAQWLELEDKVSKSIDKVIKDYKHTVTVSLYYTSDTTYDIIRDEIVGRYFSVKGGTVRGLSGSLLRMKDTWVRTGNSTNAHNDFINLKALGYKVRKRWVYTYESKTYRMNHRAHDGIEADEDGFFSINGKRTVAPRLFGDPAEDYNCKCNVALTIDE